MSNLQGVAVQHARRQPVVLLRQLHTRQARRAVAHAVVFVCLCVAAGIVILPFAWMISTSLKTAGDVFLRPPRWIPREIHWQDYVEALTAINFGQMYLNTTFIAVSAAIGQVLSASLVGFGFARLRAPGRNLCSCFWSAPCCCPSRSQ